MDTPSMVQRSGDTLIVRSVVSGNQIFLNNEKESNNLKNVGSSLYQNPQYQQNTFNSITDCFAQYEHLNDETTIARCVQSSNKNSTDNAKIEATDSDVAQNDGAKDEGLPQCKIKRNYSCNSCKFFTQNPRIHLTHLRDKHGEKIVINECKLCLYASRHYQKLVRHMKMVHGSTDGIEENGSARKRQLGSRDSRKRKINDNQNSIPMQTQKFKNLSNASEDNRVQSMFPKELSPDNRLNTDKTQSFEDYSEDNIKNRLLKCSLCDYTSLFRTQLMEHENEEHCHEKFFRCSKCSYVTHIKARFSKHVKYHSMPMIKCCTCDFRTPYKWNLDRHMKNHGGTGTFKCSTCNFTADIKQSLTVHEMNHHVPPVGHAAGMTNLRRKNKVGGTDISEDIFNETGEIIEDESNSNIMFVNKNNDNNNNDSNNNAKNQNINFNMSYGSGISVGDNDNSFNNDAIDNSVEHEYDILNKSKKLKYDFETDRPTDLSHKPTLNLLAFNNNTEQSGTSMNIKSNRPIPNLIPIQAGALHYQNKKQANIYADSSVFQDESVNLRQIAIMLFGKEIPKDLLMHLPQLSPDSESNNSSSSADAKSNLSNNFSRKKSENVFNKIKQCFAEGITGSNGFDSVSLSLENLTCKCGYVSKYLSEFYIHRNTCAAVLEKFNTFADKSDQIDSINNNCEQKHSSISPINLSINSQTDSTRCQHCRHRCKSSANLISHLKNCSEIGKSVHNCFDSGSYNDSNEQKNENQNTVESNVKEIENLSTDNKVFVWNNINQNSDNLALTISSEIFAHDASCEVSSKNELVKIDINQNSDKNDEISFYGVETAPGYGEVTKKSITDEEAANASLKKVYKCPHCSFWASTASRFHVHIVGHLNKKPFECSLCNYRSNWRWDITKHIRLKTIRDPSHKNARVLMNDETGRRNYTKYNKYITLMKVTDEDGDPKLMKSGEMTPNQEASLSFLKNYDNKNLSGIVKNVDDGDKKGTIMAFSSMIHANPSNSQGINNTPPELIKANSTNKFKLNLDELVEVKNVDVDQEKMKIYRCKECNYKHANRDMLVAHVKRHTTSVSFDNVKVNSTNMPKLESLERKINTNSINLVNDMLAIAMNKQQEQQSSENNIENNKDLVQHLFNLNLVASGALNNMPNIVSDSNKYNNGIKNNSDNGEIDEASSIGVVTTTSMPTATTSCSLITTTNTSTTCTNNDIGLNLISTTSTNHLLNKTVNNDLSMGTTVFYPTTTTKHNSLISSNTNMVNGSKTTGCESNNKTLTGGIILGTSSCKNINNNFSNSHSVIEQNINHNISDHKNNSNNNNLNLNNNNNTMGFPNGGHNIHNTTDQWRGPAPYRCGHCHQVSNWKHVIQRHCRLKHNGDIRIETIDRSSDKHSPIYRALGATTTQYHSGRKSSSQNFQNIQLSAQQHHQTLANGSNISCQNSIEFDNIFHNQLYVKLNKLNYEKLIRSEEFENSKQHQSSLILPSNSTNSSKCKQQLCSQCPYVSESKSQMNYHVSLHKAKQYECKNCGKLFNKKQELFIHIKHEHEDQHQKINGNSLVTPKLNDISLNFTENLRKGDYETVSSKPEFSNLDSSDKEDDEEERKLVIDLMETPANNIGAVVINSLSNPTSNIHHNEGSTNKIESINLKGIYKISFCSECPTRFLSREELKQHIKFHHNHIESEMNKKMFKCHLCSFKAKQEHSLLSHFSVHQQEYHDRTESLIQKHEEDIEFPKPILEKIIDIWVVKSNLSSKPKSSYISENITSLFEKKLEANIYPVPDTNESNNTMLKFSNKSNESDIQRHEKLQEDEGEKSSFSLSSILTTRKCSYCPFETENQNIHMEHLKCHYAVSKILSKYLCSHCDYSTMEEYDYKSHIKYHFNSINNNDKTVNFFTSYNQLELNLNDKLNIEIEDSQNDSHILGKSTILYKAPNINEKKNETCATNDATNDGKGCMLNANCHNKCQNVKNIIDIKTGQIVDIESSDQ